MDLSLLKLNTAQKVGITPIREHKILNNINFEGECNTVSLPAVNKSAIVSPNIPVNYKKIGQIKLPYLEKEAEVFKLSNGQIVVIAPKKGLFRIETIFNVGSDNEHYKQKEISHCIEHNMYGGSKYLTTGEYSKKVDLTGGYDNAETTRDRTQYYIDTYLLDDNTLEECIRLNAQLTQYPRFDKKYFENEKGAIKS